MRKVLIITTNKSRINITICKQYRNINADECLKKKKSVMSRTQIMQKQTIHHQVKSDDLRGSDQITSHNLNQKHEGREEEEKRERERGAGGKLIFIKTKMVRWTRETAGKQFISCSFGWCVSFGSSWWPSSWWRKLWYKHHHGKRPWHRKACREIRWKHSQVHGRYPFRHNGEWFCSHWWAWEHTWSHQGVSGSWCCSKLLLDRTRRWR